MKLSYYGYSFNAKSDNKHYLMDMRAFLHSFCKFTDIKYKNSFKHRGEYLYLLPVKKDIFLFIMTKSNEVIKRIQSKDLSVGEVDELLSRGENIGFASYVYVDKHYYGFASTVMAPKFSSFTNFINDILESVGINKYLFVSHPMLVQSTKADVLKMPFIGRTSIQVSRENKFYEDIRNFVGGSAEEFIGVDSFEVTIKPRPRQNIDAAAKKFIKSVPDAGLDKMLVRAKEEAHDHLIDLYLAGKGAVSDTISKKREIDIYENIYQLISDNVLLFDKVKEYESDEKFKKKDIKSLLHFNDPNSWPDCIVSI